MERGREGIRLEMDRWDGRLWEGKKRRQKIGRESKGKREGRKER